VGAIPTLAANFNETLISIQRNYFFLQAAVPERFAMVSFLDAAKSLSQRNAISKRI
jgi:hypothetical protein